MSVLEVGGRCYSCALVDFLPFACPGCTHVFCREHVQSHACDAPQAEAGPSEWRKRLRGTCAYGKCETETIESIGGLEGSSEDNVARKVRCVCGGAYCIAHRSQEAHECTAPRELSARHDAVLERRDKAKELLAKHFPKQAAKGRVLIPQQVDKTRSGSPPPASKSQPIAQPIADTPAPAVSPAQAIAPTPTPAPPAARTADEKIYKVHQTKIRSLSRPLDPKVSRDASAAVEFVVDESANRVRAWIGARGKYAPTAAAAGLGTGKPERLWVPNVMPGGKLFDSLVAKSKFARGGAPLSVLVISLRPDAPHAATCLDLAKPAGDQMTTGDVLVLVRGW